MKLWKGYNPELFDPTLLRARVTRVSRNLEVLKSKLKFERIVCTGKSGMGLAFPVSIMTGIPVVVVRKEAEQSHGSQVEGNSDPFFKYIILDDFIDSGDTCVKIISRLETYATRDSIERCDPPTCVAIALYSDTESHRGLAWDSPGPCVGNGLKLRERGVDDSKMKIVPTWHV